MLPHYPNLLMTDAVGPGSKPQEVVYLNLFEVTFVLPLILTAQKRDPLLLLEQATNVTFDLSPDIEFATQKFKYSTRVFLKTPTKTDTEFSITFNVNVNNSGSMESWATIKQWYDLAWNSKNGSLHYKADTIGTVIVNQHDKKGLNLRRVTYQNVQCKGLGTTELKFDSNEIWSVEARFISDYWVDEYIDNGNVIDPEFVSGY